MDCNKKYKIIFPTGYLGTDINNHNIDVNIVFEDRQCFLGTLFTIENIQSFITVENLFFWSTDMLIVKDLKKTTIENVIAQIIRENIYMSIFSHINIPLEESFDDLVHLNDLAPWVK